MLLAPLFYGYAKGIFSGRKIERAPHELMPVWSLTGGTHPDHDGIHPFRRRVLPQWEALLVRVLVMAHAVGVLKLGDVGLEGTKLAANASQPPATSWGYAERPEPQLTAEVQTPLARAAAASGSGAGEPDLPAEPKRREDRWARSAGGKAESERRAPARHAREPAARAAKWAKRAARARARGRKLGGKPPQAPTPGPRPDDRVDCTDGESRVMPGSGGGFEQAHHARATVTVGSLPVVGAHVTRNADDQPAMEPARAELAKRPETLGIVERMTAANGYRGQHPVEIAVNAGIEPSIAVGRQRHHEAPEERLAPVPEAPRNPEVRSAMKHRLKTQDGKARYAPRKTPSEPVFGVIKAVMGFRGTGSV